MVLIPHYSPILFGRLSPFVNGFPLWKLPPFQAASTNLPWERCEAGDPMETGRIVGFLCFFFNGYLWLLNIAMENHHF